MYKIVVATLLASAVGAHLILGAPAAYAVSASAGGSYDAVTLSDSAILKVAEPGGPSGTIHTGFSSLARWTDGGTVVTLEGGSGVFWDSWSSALPSSITLTDRAWVSTFEPSSGLLIGSPGYHEVATAQLITRSTTVFDARNETHHWSGWRFSGILLSVSQTVEASVTFGSSTFVVATP